MRLVQCLAGLALALSCAPALAAQLDIVGPAGSVAFGYAVAVLPNGNIVVTDPYFGGNAGAAYLYTPDGKRISTITGSQAGDYVGGFGIVVLPNGNYLLRNSTWHNGSAANAGAVTFGDATQGVAGVVSTSNSIVGTSDGDSVGDNIVVLAPTSNYVVASPFWSNGAATNAGAVTWGSGATGARGAVSAANSLVGSHANDEVGNGVFVLRDGDYVVGAANWANGAIAQAGAATWGSAGAGVHGLVSAANSLVGTTAGDFVGQTIVPLANGHYVVASIEWHDAQGRSVGAVTWGNGTTGSVGAVGAGNSLVGSTDGDRVGNFGVTALTNGHYVVGSGSWDNGALVDAGAATWCNGSGPTAAIVSTANSLYGTHAGDEVGMSVALTNGNYVASSSDWDNGAVANVGAVTFAHGDSGIVGPVSAANSVIGSTANDYLGGVLPLANGNYVVFDPEWDNGSFANAGVAALASGATGRTGTLSAANALVGGWPNDHVGTSLVALANGNYVVASPNWANNGVLDSGAVTWGDGVAGTVGVVTSANSIVGANPNDFVGSHLIALPNGNYVSWSTNWRNGPATLAGAVTWGSGSGPSSGFVSAANSLVGMTTNDVVGEYVGHPGVFALADGNYVVASSYWDRGVVADAGAVTWGDGASGTTGPVSTQNSIVGSTTSDQVGALGIAAFSGGYYGFFSGAWDNGALADAGAVTLGAAGARSAGPIGPDNSVLGTVASPSLPMSFSFDASRARLAVGRAPSNRVTLIDFVLFRDGFE